MADCLAGGLVLLEHVNLNVEDWPSTEEFYVALGCERRPGPTHMNCGPHTQFHLAVEKPVQTWRGEITIAYTAAGLQGAEKRLRDCKSVEVEVVSGVLRVWGPLGIFHLREGTEAELQMAALRTSRPNTDSTIALGVLGIVELALPVATGASHSLAMFYEEVFRFRVEVGTGEAAIIGGPVEGSQRIVLREMEEVPPYCGDHFCMYIGDFEGSFSRCAQRGLLYVNPRFTFLDDSRTLEQARHFQAFRIMQAKGQDGAELLTEEHEIRSVAHRFLSLPCPLG